MLVQSKNLVGAQIVSLHTGHVMGSLGEIIISPHKLEVVGFYVQTPKSRSEPMVLLARDIRQVDSGRAFINSIDEVTSAAELVRFKEIFDIKYVLADKAVRTVSKHKLGRVEEYTVDTLNWLVQKLYVKQSLFKSLAVHSLAIDRQQVVEVSDREITVNDAVVTQARVAPQRAV